VLGRTATLMTELGGRPLVDDGLLARIHQPVRLMVGDRDALVSIDETASVARKLVQGQLAVLPGTPHPIEQVRSGIVASMILDFLR
jgi:pimeloyl-ACP methyl ester carboxylesterase